MKSGLDAMPLFLLDDLLISKKFYHGIQALFRSFFVAVFLGFQLERNDVGRTAIQAKIFELFPHLK